VAREVAPHSNCAGAEIVCYNSGGILIARTETHGGDDESWEEKREKKQAGIQKSSAEALRRIFPGTAGFGIHGETIQAIARELKDVHALGVQVAIMVGGGISSRREAEGFRDRPRNGDYMGMLATVINALALQDALEKEGVFTRVRVLNSLANVVNNGVIDALYGSTNFPQVCRTTETSLRPRASRRLFRSRLPIDVAVASRQEQPLPIFSNTRRFGRR